MSGPVPVNYGKVLTEIQMHEKEVEIIVDVINNMPKNGLMIEWGSGGSTCKWLETKSDTQKLITIEHNENWFNRVNRAIKNEWGTVKNFDFYHIPEKYGFEHGYGNPLEEHPLGTDEYVNPNEEIWNADFFFIDGIARATCAMYVLLKHKKKNPIIFMHDYVGREPWYEWALQLFDKETFNANDGRMSTLVKLTMK